jgi:hypothetical protein
MEHTSLGARFGVIGEELDLAERDAAQSQALARIAHEDFVAFRDAAPYPRSDAGVEELRRYVRARAEMTVLARAAARMARTAREDARRWAVLHSMYRELEEAWNARHAPLSFDI